MNYIVAEFVGIQDFNKIASTLQQSKKELKFIKSMYKTPQGEIKLLTGVLVQDFWKEWLLTTAVPFNLVKIETDASIVQQFELKKNIDEAYKSIMNELEQRKQAMSSCVSLMKES